MAALEERIIEWSQELGCPLRLSPSIVSPLCQGAHSVSMWNFLLDRVHSPQNIQQIRRTLALSSSASNLTPEQEERRRELLEKRKRLQEDVALKNSEISSLSAAVHSLKSSITQEEKKLKQTKEIIFENKVKGHLLVSHAAKTDFEIKEMNEFQQRISNSLSSGGALMGEKTQDRDTNDTRNPLPTFFASEGEEGKIKIESREERLVRVAMSDSVSKMMETILEKGDIEGLEKEKKSREKKEKENENKNEKNKEKENAGEKEREIGKEIFSSLSPSELLSLLRSMALSSIPSEEGAGKGREGRRRRGGEGRGGKKGGARQELKNKYEQQINFFLQIQKIENKTLVLHPQIQNKWKEIFLLQQQLADESISSLSSSLSSSFSPSSLQKCFVLKAELTNLKIQLQVEKKGMDTLKTYISSLGKQIRRKKEVIDQARSLHNSLILAKKERHARKALIEKLYQNNAQFFDVVAHYTQKTKEMRKLFKTISPFPVSLPPLLFGRVKKDISFFYTTPYENLKRVHIFGEIVKVSELSVYETEREGRERGGKERASLLFSLLSLLDLFHACPEHVLHQIISLKGEGGGKSSLSAKTLIALQKEYERRDVREILAISSSSSSSSSSSTSSSSLYHRLQQAGEAVALTYENTLLPLLSSARSETEKTEKLLKKTKQLSDEWWNQPAAHLTPEVRVEGYRLSDWEGRWKELCHATQQQQLQQQQQRQQQRHQHQYQHQH